MDKNIIKAIMLTSPFCYNIFCNNSKKKCKCSNSSKDSAKESSDEESTDAESDNEDNKKKDQRKPEEKPEKTKKEKYIDKTNELRGKFEEYKKIINGNTTEIVSETVSNHQCGFHNYGNTCYFNAAMQNLTHNKELVKAILDYVEGIKDKSDIEIIAFYYLIINIYEQEKEREKDNSKKPVIYKELNDLRYFFAFKGILDEFYFRDRENFFTTVQQDSQELLNKLIEDIKAILNDKLKIFDICDDERVKCSNDKHNESQQYQIGNIKQYKFEENKRTDDPKTYYSINEFINKPIIETLENGSDCSECIKEELKKKYPNFDANIENEYKEISECINCKKIYKGIADKDKPKNGLYTNIDENITIQHCEICNKIYNSKCKTHCEKIHNEICKEKTSKCSKKQRKSKTIKLKTINKYLIIQLARFSYKNNAEKSKKIEDEVNFEEKLNFISDGKTENLDLVGIICHTGTPDGGHYFSYNKIGNKWYEFNDSNVSPVQDNNILKATNIQKLNYLLFYKKQ